MLSVVSEAASEGMLFSAICAPSRFHTAKTQSGHWQYLMLKMVQWPRLVRTSFQNARQADAEWCGMKHSLLGFFLFFDRFEEVDANLIAIDPSELAAPICFSHGRKHQEKLLHGKTLNRTVDCKSSAGIRHILHCAGPPPSTVDRHHVSGKSPLKYDTMCLALFHLNQSSN
jgi:hypothetical protein